MKSLRLAGKRIRKERIAGDAVAVLPALGLPAPQIVEGRFPLSEESPGRNREDIEIETMVETGWITDSEAHEKSVVSTPLRGYDVIAEFDLANAFGQV